nr:DUF1573 domain-containing protein [Saprospiraceae bacterium]
MKKFVSSFAAATFAILALTFVACKNNSETAATASETTATTAPLAETTTTTTTTETANATVSNSGNATTTPITQAATAPTGPTTSIEFKEVEYDYGTIKAGEKAVHIYKFKNTGKEPLIISDAKGSYGCTVPQWPKEPISPGKEGEKK